MYGLKKADILAFNYVVQNLVPFGYHPVRHIAGLWKHETRRTVLKLCVDDFSIKYHSKKDVEYLLNALTTNYEILTD